MARLKISKLENYIHILDMDRDVLYQEHSFRVFVRKISPDGVTYNISFLRPDSTPGSFYNATIGQLYDSTGTLWNQVDWENWYQLNTGDIHTTTIIMPGAGQRVAPYINISTGDSPILISDSVLSISFASIGTAPALVTFDGGILYVPLSPGTTVNQSAGSEDRYFDGGQFGYDTSVSGASLLITYNLDI